MNVFTANRIESTDIPETSYLGQHNAGCISVTGISRTCMTRSATCIGIFAGLNSDKQTRLSAHHGNPMNPLFPRGNSTRRFASSAEHSEKNMTGARVFAVEAFYYKINFSSCTQNGDGCSRSLRKPKLWLELFSWAHKCLECPFNGPPSKRHNC